MMTETFESENLEFTNNIIDLNEKNTSTQVRTVQKGHAKFKRLYVRKIHEELRHRMKQWRLMLSLKAHKAKVFDKVILGNMKKRFYRASFDKFKSSLNQIDQF
jgi:monomeric isocitrate dehydrogenase